MTSSINGPAGIINLALGKLGHSRRVGSLYDGSEEAKAALDWIGEWPFPINEHSRHRRRHIMSDSPFRETTGRFARLAQHGSDVIGCENLAIAHHPLRFLLILTGLICRGLRQRRLPQR